MKRRVWIAVMLALALMLSACGDVTVTVAPPSEQTDATYMGLSVDTIHTEDDSEYGLIEDFYPAHGSTTVTLGDVVGDTDILNPTGFRVTSVALELNAIDVLFDAKFPVVFTAKQYSDGVVTDYAGIPQLDCGGIVEKFNVDGTWSRAEFAELHTPGRVVEERFLNYGIAADEFPLLVDGAVSISMPFESPGIYRYTLYFRECIDAKEETRTTGEEMYTLSVIFSIPTSDKKYDVVAVSGIEPDAIFYGDYKGEQGYRFDILVRVNNVKDRMLANRAPVDYSLTNGGTLERLVNGEWEMIPGGIPIPDHRIHGVSGGPADETNALLHTNRIYDIYIPELVGKYRFTGNFEAGFAGDNDILSQMTLCFDFGE